MQSRRNAPGENEVEHLYNSRHGGRSFFPTSDERKAVFYWLKQCSSYIAWARALGFYKAFVAEVKQVHEAGDDGSKAAPLVRTSELTLLLGCLASFEEALIRLRRGDKSVFRFIGYGSGSPYFCEAGRALEAWGSQLFAVQGQGLDWPLMDSPFWPAIEAKYSDAASSFGELERYVCESRHTDVPAYIEDMATERAHHGDGLSLLLLRTDLPAVPDPQENVLVATGDNCPASGVWEPVKVDRKAGLTSLFRKPRFPTTGPYELDGCMNYLHQGSSAPSIGYEGDNARQEGRPTVWRLLWKDDRYADDSVPEEESTYVFRKPERKKLDRTEAHTPLQDLTIAVSSEPAPRGGHWAVVDELDGRVVLLKGEPLPLYKGNTVKWIWTGDSLSNSPPPPPSR